MAQIVWTDEARRWLQEIYDYIAENNEEAAYRTVRAIHERAELRRQTKAGKGSLKGVALQSPIAP